MKFTMKIYINIEYTILKVNRLTFCLRMIPFIQLNEAASFCDKKKRKLMDRSVCDDISGLLNFNRAIKRYLSAFYGGN
jgi:hypothetical protein